MAGARSRSRDLRSNETGTIWFYLTGPSTKTFRQGRREWNEDTVGLVLFFNEFHLKQWDTLTTVLNGTYMSGTQKISEFTNAPIGYQPLPSDSRTIFPVPSALEKNNLAWEILAETNPGQAHVSIPQFVAEMKDIPGLFRDWGGSLMRRVARGHLSWRWAIKPLVSDLTKMLDFTRAVDERIKWLESLRERRQLRRRVSLGSEEYTAPTQKDILVHSERVLLYMDRTTTYRYKQWGSVTWKLAPGVVLPTTNEDMRKYAYRLAHGLTTWNAVLTTWELLPWSWLVDWFAGVGQTLQAYNNSIPVNWTNIGLMRTTTSQSTYVTSDGHPVPAWLSLSGFPAEKETRKDRWSISPILPFSITTVPLITQGKWSILLSLAALRLESAGRR